MRLAFPEVRYSLDKTDWFATLPNGSQIWFGGLDDKERTEKVLGMEFVTIYLNECSQIPYESRNLALTRLAQAVEQKHRGQGPVAASTPRLLRREPALQGALDLQAVRPEDRPGDASLKWPRPDDYAAFKINPEDNAENIADDYLDTLDGMSARLRKRFRDGEFGDATPGALFTEEAIEKWRVIDGVVPDMVRVVVAVDPSGAGDEDNADNDEIGIAVVRARHRRQRLRAGGLQREGRPATWGRIARRPSTGTAADVVVGETNYGGAMVGHVIQTARPRTNFKPGDRDAGQGRRAEPFSALYENGKVRHAGRFPA
jgi:hypothetical protein